MDQLRHFYSGKNKIYNLSLFLSLTAFKGLLSSQDIIINEEVNDLRSCDQNDSGSYMSSYPGHLEPVRPDKCPQN